MSRNSLSPVEIWERKRVGAILRFARERRHKSLEEVGAWFTPAKSRPFLANIEAGRKPMPAYMLPILCERLDVDPIIFARAGDMPTEDAA